MSIQVIHATTIAVESRAILLMGRSGSGKSSLGLELMALGAALVADDRTELFVQDGALFARAPAVLRGLIEARGIGLLNAETCGAAQVVAAMDLSHTETDRLPEYRQTAFLGHVLPLLHTPVSGPTAAALLQYLKAGRAEPAQPTHWPSTEKDRDVVAVE